MLIKLRSINLSTCSPLKGRIVSRHQHHRSQQNAKDWNEAQVYYRKTAFSITLISKSNIVLNLCKCTEEAAFVGSFGLSTKEPYTMMLCPSSLASSSVHTSPWHMVRHRNFIFGIHVHICPPYMHIKYLVILTYSF